ncbi:hypothetical protein [Plasmodium yoelii yoelii]|uniref:Uncharacterized protein n=1 Tax=Plasmodium yoelii yoelii TaxID=73239 RepID=Q7RG85_PLAYO|nr:hypothetical protein [Plasmodium yoelii yoelii]
MCIRLVYCTLRGEISEYNGTISALNKNPLNQCTIFHSFICLVMDTILYILEQ